MTRAYSFICTRIRIIDRPHCFKAPDIKGHRVVTLEKSNFTLTSKIYFIVFAELIENVYIPLISTDTRIVGLSVTDITNMYKRMFILYR